MFRSARAPGLTVGRPPDEVLPKITAHMTREGYVVAQSGPASATFTKPKRPAVQMVVLLTVVTFLVFVILRSLVAFPLLVLVCYLLYFPVVRPRAATGVTVLGFSGGSEIVLSGNDWEGWREVRRWVQDTDTC